MRIAGLFAIATAILVCARDAAAQQAPPPVKPGVDTSKIDLTKCNKADQKAAPTLAPLTVAPNYKTYEITGELVDPPETVRALLDPTMRANPNLNEEARKAIAEAAAKIGYELVGLTTTQLRDDTTKATVFIAPRPMVRKVDINVHQNLVDALIDDDIRHHMQLRVGSYLPWKPLDRACARLDEHRNLEDFLRTAGYYDAVVEVTEKVDKGEVQLTVDVQLGAEYHLGRISFADTGPLAVPESKITAVFEHKRFCIFGPICVGTLRFMQKQHEEDKKKVLELFHKAGYPAVRVQSDVDYKTTFDRRSKTVPFTLRIDQRRHVDVVFEGNDPDAITDESLRGQLTFEKAQSADDVEAAESAKAITKYLQTRGYFEAKVTWTRERFAIVDHVIFRIQAGNGREVKRVEFVGTSAVSGDTLGELVATKPAKVNLFGDTLATTSEQLADDVSRIKNAYRRAGYRDARIRVSAASDPAGLSSAALAASLVAGNRGDGLYVRFSIDEGAPTNLIAIEIANDDGDVTLAGTPRAVTADATKPDRRLTKDLCASSLKRLSELLGDPSLAQRPTQRCVANARGNDPKAKGGEFREDDVQATKDQMRDWLYNTGRPRAEVDYKAVVTAPGKITAHYQLGRLDLLKFGKVIIRGNFRTRPSIILGELRFKEGSPLTSEALADGVRRVRETGLFDAVNVDPLDLKTTSADEVNAVITVQERYDYLASINTEGGYSSLNGLFAKVAWSQRNLFGIGLSFEPAVTVGTEIRVVEGTIRAPQWLSRPFSPIEFTTELTAFYRQQNTPQFGPLTTEGVTLGLSRTFKRQRTAKQEARALSVGIHYDYRLRERNVDVIRPIGADDDQPQVPIQTTTGSVGVTLDWDQRVDRTGTLQQLAPDGGFRFSTQVSVASHYLLGQDTFIKASVSGTKYQSLGQNLLLRADLRYDEGFPLGGSVLLPEVERFFAGGDATVRGFDDDRLATEIITVGVPPLGNLQQIRIVPSGGNIRVMGSLDAQVRIYKFLASGLFTDAGMITNQWGGVTSADIRPSVGMALLRAITPFGGFAIEYAVPVHPRLGDDPRGRWHISFAARAQF